MPARPADPRPNLLGFVPADLVAWSAATGHPLAEAAARQILARLVTRGEDDPTPRRTTVPRAALDHLRAAARWDRPREIARVEDPEDGAVRYLFEAPDGARFEAVRIPLHRPGATPRFSVCVSSQAGCAMACAFCATGRLGLLRNLDAAEIVGQVLAVRADAPGRVAGVVFMGQGEPLHNPDEVLRAARVLCDPAGGALAAKALTISTVGIPAQIRRLAREAPGHKLVVSLTSAVPERRRALLPVAGRIPPEELADAIREYAATLAGRPGAVGQRLTLAWVLLGGVNDGPDEVEALRRTFGGLPLRLNLVDVNDPRPDGFRRSTDAERAAFVAGLRTLGVPVVRRRSVGRSRHAACGMLASRAASDLAPPPR